MSGLPGSDTRIPITHPDIDFILLLSFGCRHFCTELIFKIEFLPVLRIKKTNCSAKSSQIKKLNNRFVAIIHGLFLRDFHKDPDLRGKTE